MMVETKEKNEYSATIACSPVRNEPAPPKANESFTTELT
jgi:hypothetical protein